MSRLMFGCREIQHTAPGCWSSVQQGARERKIGKRLRQMMGRLVDAMEATGTQAMLSVRNTLARLRGRGNGREARDAATPLREAEAPRHSFNQQTSDPCHQSLQVISKPRNYLEKCRSNKTSASGGSLQPTPNTPWNEKIGKRAWEGRQGDGERGSEVGQTGDAEDGIDEVAGGTLTIPKPPFSAEELEHYLVRAIHFRNLNDQLKNVPLEDNTRSKSVATLPCNKKKNRYKNNIPYDESRVVLDGRGQDGYINASYISCSLEERRFIATQGPMGANQRTVEDFWLMVWQNNTNVIVMVANLVEGGREKVTQYWPNTPGETVDYRDVKVLMNSEKKYFDYTVRHFIVSMNRLSRHVVQYQYTAWPDHLVPANPVGAALMVTSICKWQWTGPPVIHCSAGLGRTGAILLVLVLLDSLHTKGQFHPPSALRTLRMCRANLLDNQLQYRFAHHVLLEVLFGYKTRCTVDKLCDKDYLAVTNNSLHKQFRELKSFPTGLTYHWARTQDLTLNRNSSVLPADGRQVLLMAPEGHAGDQYVNAVRVRGVNLQEAFLVTEHPMTRVVGRAWRLAYLAKVSAWVFLHDHRNQPDEEDFPSVLPSDGHAELEGITVHVDGEVEKRFYTETSVTVSQHMPHTMYVIQFKNWNPSKEVPEKVESLVTLVLRLQELQRAEPLRMIMVSCSDGYSASGMLVTLARLVMEVRLTQRVNVFRCVLSVLFDRPQFIKSKRQYSCLHEAVVAYHQMTTGARKRRRSQAGGQEVKEEAGQEEEKDVHNARKNERKSDNGLIMHKNQSLKNNEREIYNNREGRKERKEMESQISRKSRTEIEEKKWETVDVNKERNEKKGKDGTRESDSRSREERKKRDTGNNIEGKGKVTGKQSKMKMEKKVRSGVKEESHYECVWLGELQKKEKCYENIWDAKEGHQTDEEDKKKRQNMKMIKTECVERKSPL